MPATFAQLEANYIDDHRALLLTCSGRFRRNWSIIRTTKHLRHQDVGRIQPMRNPDTQVAS
jgi:hypothetical protein